MRQSRRSKSSTTVNNLQPISFRIFKILRQNLFIFDSYVVYRIIREYTEFGGKRTREIWYFTDDRLYPFMDRRKSARSAAKLESHPRIRIFPKNREQSCCVIGHCITDLMTFPASASGSKLEAHSRTRIFTQSENKSICFWQFRHRSVHISTIWRFWELPSHSLTDNHQPI